MWHANYIGMPFDDDDAHQGAHCWGLVRRVFADVRGIALPAHSELSSRDMIAMAREVRDAITSNDGPWQAVPKGQEREFDVAVMTGPVDYGDGDIRTEPCHVGIITPDRQLLHVERATAAVYVPLTHPTIRFRYFGSFRYAA